MASLLLIGGPNKGMRLPLEGDRFVLGRESRCDVVINESLVHRKAGSQTGSVSRRHAVITRVEGAYFIEDGDGQGNSSRNGTFVNDQRVTVPERRRLRNNDRIRICDFVCTFHEEREAAFTVEAAIDHDSSTQSFHTQPAEKLRILLEISNSLSSTLDLDALLARMVDQLFRLFEQAQRGFIILRDETSGELLVRAFKTRRQSAGASDRFSASIVRRCLENKQAILGNDLVEQFPDSDSVNTLPIRSLMCAPLWSQEGKPLGAIQLDTEGKGSKFTQEDLNLLSGVASQASIALSNASLHRDALVHQRREKDMEVAHEIQLALLPRHLPKVPGYEFSAWYEPAHQIGGDYYDFIPLPEQRLAVLLGDVAGKGVAAALVMVKFSVEARVCLEREPDLPAAVSKLNDLMNRVSLSDRFVTLIAMLLDPATHTVTLVNAGHPSPLLCRYATGKVEEVAPSRDSGPPIGIADGHLYTGREAQLQPGDNLLLFSDGVVDALDVQERPFRTKGIHAVLEKERLTAIEMGERLKQAVKRHACGCRPNDDITVVCFGRMRG
jgi:serine phosphatase RsbU (regulator of sigma subunit)